MPVNIHGKQYKTVAERLVEIGDKLTSVDTEVLFSKPVVIKATIITDKGTFSGISGADPDKTIEKKTPWEVAETSAVGRALAFAGYLGSEIASADEMQKALADPEYATDKQLGMINRLIKEGKVDDKVAVEIGSMTKMRASELISKGMK